MSGFRVNFSTDSCLAQLTDFVLKGMDKRMHTGMILMVLQKVIDTLDHKILLEKMSYLSFKKSAIKWFESYLSNTKFFISVNDVFSEAGIFLSLGTLFGTNLALRKKCPYWELFWSVFSPDAGKCGPE